MNLTDTELIKTDEGVRIEARRWSGEFEGPAEECIGDSVVEDHMHLLACDSYGAVSATLL